MHVAEYVMLSTPSLWDIRYAVSRPYLAETSTIKHETDVSHLCLLQRIAGPTTPVQESGSRSTLGMYLLAHHVGALSAGGAYESTC